jgi:DNA mismatch endonuclease, patch repair protein
MDTMTPAERSARMALIRSRNTSPEIKVRRLAHKLGYRFRLHEKALPGCPDLVFKSRRKVIFVHGCFWHQHTDPKCKVSRKPKSNQLYWTEKLRRNASRDVEHEKELSSQGWKVLTVWECQLTDEQEICRAITRFLK